MVARAEVGKHIHSRLYVALWSAVFATLAIIVAVVTLYVLAPQKISVKTNARGLSDGTRKVVVRAISTATNADILSLTANATVKDGVLTTDFVPPRELEGKSYVVEICTTKSGTSTESCSTASNTPKTSNAPTSNDEPLYSCPYYVSEQKSSKIANLTSQNVVEADNKVGCQGENKEGVSTKAEFSQQSSIVTMQAMQTQGLSVSGNGVVVASNGQLSTVSVDSLLPKATQNVTNQYYTVAASSPTPALMLEGRTLSLGTDNSVTLPADSNTTYPIADGTTDGIISATDWNTFASKENSLTFDNGLIRTGDTIGLMSCAAGQILKNDGSTWVCAADAGSALGTYTAGTGIMISGANVISNQGMLGVTASGALASSGGQNPAITLATSSDLTQLAGQLALSNTGVSAGTYNNVTVDAKGRVTNATNVAYLTTEADSVVGNEVAGVVTGGGLVMTGTGTVGDPYKVGLITSCVNGQVMKWNGSSWACANDIDTNTDAQTLGYNPGTNVLSLVNGGTVDLSDLQDNTDSQAISRTGNTISITGSASTVDLTPYLDNTDGQTLTITNPSAGNHTISISGGNSQSWAESQALSYNGGTRTISLTNGGSVVLPTDQDTTYSAGNGLALTGTVFSINAPTCVGTDKLQWNGSAFVCAADVDTNTDVQTLSWNNGTRTLTISGSGSSVVVPDTNTTYSAGTGLSLVGTTFSLTNDFGSSIDSSEITNGTIAATDLANSGATAGTYGDTGVSIAQLTVNAQGQVTSVSNRALPTANTTTSGILTSTDWNTFNGKENVLTFTGNGLFSRAGNTITGLAGTVSGQVMKWNGSAWVAGTDNDTTYSAGNGLSLASTTLSINSPTCSGTTKLQWNGTAFVCSADVDTDTTNFNILANGAGSQNVAAGNNVNFQNGTGTTASVDASKNVSFSLTNVGTAGTYGSATAVPVITTDAQGRVTGVASTPINFPAEVDGVIGNEVTAATANGGLARAGSGTSGSPYTLGLLTTCGDQQILKYTLGTTTWGCANDSGGTSYTASNGITLTGSNFTLTNDFDSSIDSSEITNGTIAAADLANSGATAGTYSDTGVNVAQLTVNAQGQVTSVSNRALPTANTTTTGILTSTDWNTFNGKENVLTFTGNGLFSRTSNTITGLAGTVTNQVIKWNGSAWVAGTDADTTYTNGTGIALAGTTFSLNCAGTGASGVAFCQGGNSFGQAANIGTNDAFALNLETGGTTRFTVDSATNTLTGNGVTTIASTAGNALNLDSGTTGAINIGTGANAKTLTFGNATGATGLVLTSGTAGISASTTASTTDGITFTANSITSATAFQLNTTGLTTGNAFEITGPTETGGTGGNTMLRVRNDNTQGFNQPRVIIGVGDTNNPDALARDQLYVFGRINSSWQQQWSECLSGLASTTASTAGTLTPNGYIAGNTAAGTLALGTAVNGSGICRITTTSTTTAGQMNSLSGGTINSTQRQYNPVFEARVSGSASNGTTQRAVIGFTSRTVNGVISTDATAVLTANNNFGLYGAYFRKNATDTTWSAVTTNNGTATTTGLATTTNAFHRLRIEVDNIKTEVRFYADGALVATHTTNLPPATQFFGYGASQGSSRTTAGTAITLDIDYMRIWSDDPPAAEAQAPAEVIGSIVNRDTAESNGVSTTEVQAELADEAEQLEAQLPGVVIDNSGSLDQIKLANGLLAKINTLDERLGALEAKAADVKSAVWNGGIVSEDTTFNGLVTFNSNVVFSSDSAGTVTIPVGETKAVVVYKSSQVVQPKVVASPQDFVTGAWRVTASTGAGFTIELQQAQNQPVTLDWHAFVGR